MTPVNGFFRVAQRLECNSCGSVVMAQHIEGSRFRIACWNDGCAQSGTEFAYEQPLIELKPCEEQPS